MTTERANDFQAQITKEALALMVIHGESVSVDHYEQAVTLIGHAWALPSAVTDENLALIRQERDVLHRIAAGETADHVLPEAELPMNAILTLAAAPERFKGKKPTALILPSGVEVKVPTWKKAVAAILKDCSSNPRRHEQMLELRGRLFGNFRPPLAQTPEGMGAPLKIDDGLYWESKFDTEALLRNLTDKLLCRVGYDYQGVTVKYRDPQQEIVSPVTDEREYTVPTLSM